MPTVDAVHLSACAELLPPGPVPTGALPALSASQRKALTQYARARARFALGRRSRAPSRRPLGGEVLVHVLLREGAAYWSEGCARGTDPMRAIDGAVDSALRRRRQHFGAPGPQDLAVEAELSVELTMLGGAVPLSDLSDEGLELRFERGLHGAALSTPDGVAVLPPAVAISQNGDARWVFGRLALAAGLQAGGYRDSGLTLLRLDALHLVQPRSQAAVLPLRRGQRLVPKSAVSQTGLTRFLAGVGEALIRQILPSGRGIYAHSPTHPEDPAEDNILRQWMVSDALGELYRHTGDPRYAEAWRRHAGHYLGLSYRERRGLGYIWHRGQAKLGAAAIATIALLRGPAPQAFAATIRQLERSLEASWRADGSFRTFLEPEGRCDHHSYYAGEAMLALSLLQERSPSPQRLAKLERSRELYMAFFRRSGRYAPIVPWLTMAFWRLYGLTRDPAWRVAAFELNDWLTCIQDIEADSVPEQKGRFFLPRFAEHGGDHAAATGVYVEGLAYAYDLARRARDKARADLYLRAIQWGLRHLMQLQFTESDSFYLADRQAFQGAIRTTLLDHRVRCDNNQHAAQAALAVLELVPAGLRRQVEGSEASRANLRDLAAQSAPPREPGVAQILLGGGVDLTSPLHAGTGALGGAIGHADLLLAHLDAASADPPAPLGEGPPVVLAWTGPDGAEPALAALDEARLVGREPVLVQANGLHIAIHAASASRLGRDQASQRVELSEAIAREHEGVGLRVLMLRWDLPAEFEISSKERELAKLAIELGFHVIVGHYSGVARAVGFVGDAPMLFDPGGLASTVRSPGWDDRSVLASVRVEAGRVRELELIALDRRNGTARMADAATARELFTRVARQSPGAAFATLPPRFGSALVWETPP